MSKNKKIDITVGQTIKRSHFCSKASLMVNRLANQFIHPCDIPSKANDAGKNLHFFSHRECEKNKKRLHAMEIAMRLCFCEHYYKATGSGNVLFALEAMKIFHENNLKIEPNDWFIEHLSSITTILLEEASEQTYEQYAAAEAVYSAMQLEKKEITKKKQRGRSIYYEYNQIKKRTDIYFKVVKMYQETENVSSAIERTAKALQGKNVKNGKGVHYSEGRIKNIYYAEKKIMNQTPEDFMNNIVSRKV